MIKPLRGFRRGNTYRVRLRFPGQDVSGWLFSLTMKAQLSSESPILLVQKTAGDIPRDNPAGGIVYLEIGSDESALLTPGEYYYEIRREIPGDPPDVRTVMPPIERAMEKLRVYRNVTD